MNRLENEHVQSGAIRARPRTSAAWRRAAQVATVCLLTGAALGLTGASASAATGVVTVISAGGPAYTLLDPAAGCYGIATPLPPDTVVRNRTDSHVLLYTGAGCAGRPAVDLPPGGSASVAPRGIYVVS